LFAAPFDVDRLTVTAAAQPVLDDIGGPSYSGGGYYVSGNFAFSQTGTFIYQSGTALSTPAIFWLEPSGPAGPLSPEPNQHYQPRFSPDGKRLAFAKASESGIDIWVLDLER